jgi:hypothetical protein
VDSDGAGVQVGVGGFVEDVEVDENARVSLFIPLTGFGLLEAAGDDVVADEDDDAFAALPAAGNELLYVGEIKPPAFVGDAAVVPEVVPLWVGGEFLAGGGDDRAVDAGVEEVAGEFEADNVAEGVDGLVDAEAGVGMGGCDEAADGPLLDRAGGDVGELGGLAGGPAVGVAFVSDRGSVAGGRRHGQG